MKPAGERLRDIGEIRIALAEMVAHPDTARAAITTTVLHGAPLSPWWGSGTVLAAFAAVALASAGATWLVTRSGSESLVSNATRDPIHFTIGAKDSGAIQDIGGILISPDGRWVVYAGASSEAVSVIIGSDVGDEPLRVRSLGSFDDSTRVLIGTDGALYPFFSLDSEWVGYFKGGGGVRTLYRVNIESGSILPITSGTHPGYRADWGKQRTQSKRLSRKLREVKVEARRRMHRPVAEQHRWR